MLVEIENGHWRIPLAPEECAMVLWIERHPVIPPSLARNIAQSHAFLQLLAVTSAQTNAQPVIEENLVFPVFAKLQPADVLEIHDAGAMNAAELLRVEILFEICHAAPHQMAPRTDVQTGVVIGSFNPIDLGGSHERDCSGTPDDHAF